ncbi:MAG TPA: hypothetical protein VFT69_04520 [Pseudolabrys sp.]|jgi:hypothetical protein|nr:hypothetical protein [Pseudolabrys sp.]
MRIVMLALALVLGGKVMPASALDRGQPPPSSFGQTTERWSFKRVDDGFVRLDAKTGHVAQPSR